MTPRHVFPLLLSVLLLFPAVASALEFTVEASSTYTSLVHDFSPENILDNDPGTAWAEGAEKVGLGEWIEVGFGEQLIIKKIGFRNGCQKDNGFETNNRVRMVRVVLSSGQEALMQLEDIRDLQFQGLGNAATTSVRLIIEDAYEAESMWDRARTCISDVVFVLAPEGAKPGPGLVADSSKEVETPALETQAKGLVQDFYVRMSTLDAGFPDLYAKSVRDSELFAFEYFMEVQRQRGTYKYFREASVDTSQLVVEVVSLDGQNAELKAGGQYTLYLASTFEDIEVDSVFKLVREDGRWKVLDKIENEPDSEPLVGPDAEPEG